MSTWKQFTRAWILTLGYLATTSLLVFVVSRLGTALSVAWSAALFGILQIGATVALFLLLRSVLAPRVYREAQLHGLPATADILEIEATGWLKKQRRRDGWLSVSRIVRREHRLRVRVTPSVGAAYEATLFTYLEAREVPGRGARVAVKVHPRHPEVVVLSVEPSPP